MHTVALRLRLQTVRALTQTLVAEKYSGCTRLRATVRVLSMNLARTREKKRKRKTSMGLHSGDCDCAPLEVGAPRISEDTEGKRKHMPQDRAAQLDHIGYAILAACCRRSSP